MNNKRKPKEPLLGFHSIQRSSYSNKNSNATECLEITNYINLEKFGNDNLNFAAVLINGHNSKTIVNNINKKLNSELSSKNFTKLSQPEEIMNYLENIVERFEHEFLSEMATWARKKQELVKKCPTLSSEKEEANILMQIDKIENELKSGATVALVVLIRGHIYVYNIGDNQIILVSKDSCSEDIDAQQFILQTEEHSFHNEKEINRIKEDCGLNPDALRLLSMLSNERCHSRCIGDYEMKTQFTQFDCFKGAKSSPLICKPQDKRYIILEDNYTFILFISSGLFYLVRELIYDTDKVPGEISRKFFELKSQNTNDSLHVLCKKVLDCFVADHRQCHEKYLNLMDKDDQYMEYSNHDDLSIFVIDISSHLNESHVIKDDSNGYAVIDRISPSMPSTFDSLDKDSSCSRDPFSSLKSISTSIPITPYVDFSEWDIALAKMTPAEMAKLDLITNIDEAFVPSIEEESESVLMSRSTTIIDNNNQESPGTCDSADKNCIYSSNKVLDSSAT